MTVRQEDPLPRILIVDDDPVARELLLTLLEGRGYEIETAEDGEEAWQRLLQEEPKIDVVLLDWVMPRMNGMELLEAIQDDLRLQMVPVIFQTARTAREDRLRGIEAGASYYVTKPLDPDMVLSMVATAARDRARHCRAQAALKQGIQAIEMLRSAVFRFRTVEEATQLASLLSQALPDPDAAVVGLGELLLNAVEHGNLGISYAEKSSLLESNRWKEEVDRRLALPEYRDRWARADFERRDGAITVTITDEGAGFEWEPYLTIGPDRVFHRHGRGIAMARRLCFDRLDYVAPGNRVIAVVEAARAG